MLLQISGVRGHEEKLLDMEEVHPSEFCVGRLAMRSVENNPAGGRLDLKNWRIDLRELPFSLDCLLKRDCEPFKPFMSRTRASASIHSVRDPCGIKTNA
jgi:hypothetical protein